MSRQSSTTSISDIIQPRVPSRSIPDISVQPASSSASSFTRSRTKSFDSEPSNTDDFDKQSAASKRSRTPRRYSSRTQAAEPSSSSHQPLLPVQSGTSTSSSTSSSSELRAANQHGSEHSESDAATVLTEEDAETVDYGSDDENSNHWMTYTDNCRYAPAVYSWWQTDTLFYGINSFIENTAQTSTSSTCSQAYFDGLEFELHHSLAKWLHNQVYVTTSEVLVYRVYQGNVTTGIERDCDE